MYLRALPPDEYADALVAYLRERGYDWDEELVRATAPLVQEKIEKLGEYPEFAGFFFERGRAGRAARPGRARRGAREALARGRAVRRRSRSRQALRALAERLELKPRKAFQPIRVAVTGSKVSPGLFESLELLGRDESLARLRRPHAAAALGGLAASAARAGRAPAGTRARRAVGTAAVGRGRSVRSRGARCARALRGVSARCAFLSQTRRAASWLRPVDEQRPRHGDHARPPRAARRDDRAAGEGRRSPTATSERRERRGDVELATRPGRLRGRRRGRGSRIRASRTRKSAPRHSWTSGCAARQPPTLERLDDLGRRVARVLERGGELLVRRARRPAAASIPTSRSPRGAARTEGRAARRARRLDQLRRAASASSRASVREPAPELASACVACRSPIPASGPTTSRSYRADRVRLGAVAEQDHVLVVDDDPSLRLLCRVNLELEGYRVPEAATLDEARAALAASARRRPARRPRRPRDGLDLLDELQAQPELPVVLLPATAACRDERAARRRGALRSRSSSRDARRRRSAGCSSG